MPSDIINTVQICDASNANLRTIRHPEQGNVIDQLSIYTCQDCKKICQMYDHLLKRTAIQPLSEFCGRQKTRLVPIAKQKEIDDKQTLITDY
jgi:hypothetical protein